MRIHANVLLTVCIVNDARMTSSGSKCPSTGNPMFVNLPPVLCRFTGPSLGIRSAWPSQPQLPAGWALACHMTSRATCSVTVPSSSFSTDLSNSSTATRPCPRLRHRDRVRQLRWRADRGRPSCAVGSHFTDRNLGERLIVDSGYHRRDHALSCARRPQRLDHRRRRRVRWRDHGADDSAAVNGGQPGSRHYDWGSAGHLVLWR